MIIKCKYWNASPKSGSVGVHYIKNINKLYNHNHINTNGFINSIFYSCNNVSQWNNVMNNEIEFWLNNLNKNDYKNCKYK